MKNKSAVALHQRDFKKETPRGANNKLQDANKI